MDEIALVKSELKLENWAEMVRECHASGMNVTQWCIANGINKKTYYYRQRKVRQAALAELPQSENLPVFGKLQFTGVQQQIRSTVTVHLPYATLEITDGASEQTVTAVLAALKKTC